jgi:hypothetical protein
MDPIISIIIIRTVDGYIIDACANLRTVGAKWSVRHDSREGGTDGKGVERPA